jgi:hypothetical protein
MIMMMMHFWTHEQSVGDDVGITVVVIGSIVGMNVVEEP